MCAADPAASTRPRAPCGASAAPTASAESGSHRVGVNLPVELVERRDAVQSAGLVAQPGASVGEFQHPPGRRAAGLDAHQVSDLNLTLGCLVQQHPIDAHDALLISAMEPAGSRTL